MERQRRDRLFQPSEEERMTNPRSALAADQCNRRTVFAAYTALAWAVVFTAFHI
jgi:hypothetical protein